MLFKPLMEESLKSTTTFENIPGLQYKTMFISREEERILLDNIATAPWLDDLKRRVQHYGYKYDYRARKIDESMHIGVLPKWSDFLCERLIEHAIFEEYPDQLIINEYLPGQGISPHVDCVPCFGNTIASISLGSDIVIDFSRGKFKAPIRVNRRSVFIMKDECRYKWKHGIVARNSDMIEGFRVPRSRRVSLTFRKVKL